MTRFLKLPFYFAADDDAVDKYTELIEDWEDRKERAEDLGIPFDEAKPGVDSINKVLKDKNVNIDYIASFWESNKEGYTTVEMFDGVVYDFVIEYKEFLKLLNK